jgi:hypothetical protein
MLANVGRNAKGEMGRRPQEGGASQQGDHKGRPYYATKRRGRAVHSDGLSSPAVGPGHGNTRVAIACANNVQGLQREASTQVT